jgi:hypothetical protein
LSEWIKKFRQINIKLIDRLHLKAFIYLRFIFWLITISLRGSFSSLEEATDEDEDEGVDELLLFDFGYGWSCWADGLKWLARTSSEALLEWCMGRAAASWPDMAAAAAGTSLTGVDGLLLFFLNIFKLSCSS